MNIISDSTRPPSPGGLTGVLHAVARTALKVVVALFALVLMLSTLVAGVVLAVVAVVWALLRGRRPGPVRTVWKVRRGAGFGPVGDRRTADPGEVVDIEAREVVDREPPRT